jgi:hypothetical protein
MSEAFDEELDDALMTVLVMRNALHIARTRLMRDYEFVRTMTAPDMPSDAWPKFIFAVGEAEAACDQYENVIKWARSNPSIPGAFPVIARMNVLNGAVTGSVFNVFLGFTMLALENQFSGTAAIPPAVAQADKNFGEVLQKLRDTLPADLARSFKVSGMIDYRVLANEIFSKQVDADTEVLIGELEDVLDVPGRLSGANIVTTVNNLLKGLIAQSPIQPGCQQFWDEVQELFKKLFGGVLRKETHKYSQTLNRFIDAAIRFACCHLGRVRYPPGGGGGPTPA